MTQVELNSCSDKCELIFVQLLGFTECHNFSQKSILTSDELCNKANFMRYTPYHKNTTAMKA